MYKPRNLLPEFFLGRTISADEFSKMQAAYDAWCKAQVEADRQLITMTFNDDPTLATFHEPKVEVMESILPLSLNPQLSKQEEEVVRSD